MSKSSWSDDLYGKKDLLVYLEEIPSSLPLDSEPYLSFYIQHFSHYLLSAHVFWRDECREGVGMGKNST